MTKTLLKRFGRGTALATAGLLALTGIANAGLSFEPSPKYKYIDFTKIGCAVRKQDGSYWIREKEGWRSYTSDGTEQGSWLGDDLKYPYDEVIRALIEEDNAEHNCIGVGYHSS